MSSLSNLALRRYEKGEYSYVLRITTRERAVTMLRRMPDVKEKHVEPWVPGYQFLRHGYTKHAALGNGTSEWEAVLSNPAVPFIPGQNGIQNMNHVLRDFYILLGE